MEAAFLLHPLAREGGAYERSENSDDEGSRSAETDPYPAVMLRSRAPSPTRGEGKVAD